GDERRGDERRGDERRGDERRDDERRGDERRATRCGSLRPRIAWRAIRGSVSRFAVRGLNARSAAGGGGT
ncbi:hypothetical protein, partial [Nonomuraea rosea]|uniref:hypothetical protein n=1 Tax=Nonomuraea rosea TaxID=638574 RepID=UPI0031EB760D